MQLFSRALSGGMVTALGYAMSQLLRLGANLILTRLLFPEAFGVMALVTMVLIGLQMILDAGVSPAIIRSPRGDESGFLNTAWSVNVVRGVLLWGLTLLVSWPVAHIYAQPDLLWLLPLTGLSLLIGGFNPTRIETAHRHLLLMRVTALDLLSQAIAVAAMIVLAWLSGAIWALALGTVIGAVAKLWVMTWALPGERNRFAWDKSAAHELLHFGKWIVMSTACGFVLAQGDKAILGIYLSITELGIYNIGYFLASFPVLMGGAVISRVMIALYRDHHPSKSVENYRHLFRLRLGFGLGLVAMMLAMGLWGPQLVDILYDPRYFEAQLIVPAVVLALLPGVVAMGYDQAALAAGDGRGFFQLLAQKAVLQTSALLIGAYCGGLGGALIGQGLALLASYPLIVCLARRHGAWDLRQDCAVGAASVAAMALIFWVQGQALIAL